MWSREPASVLICTDFCTQKFRLFQTWYNKYLDSSRGERARG